MLTILSQPGWGGNPSLHSCMNCGMSCYGSMDSIPHTSECLEHDDFTDRCECRLKAEKSVDDAWEKNRW